MTRSEILQRRLLTIEQAAAYAAVSQKTVRRRIADGTLPAYRFGRSIRVRTEDLEAALRRLPTGGAA